MVTFCLGAPTLKDFSRLGCARIEDLKVWGRHICSGSRFLLWLRLRDGDRGQKYWGYWFNPSFLTNYYSTYHACHWVLLMVTQEDEKNWRLIFAEKSMVNMNLVIDQLRSPAIFIYPENTVLKPNATMEKPLHDLDVLALFQGVMSDSLSVQSRKIPSLPIEPCGGVLTLSSSRPSPFCRRVVLV